MFTNKHFSGPDVCNSESGSENSDHGEQWTYKQMSTANMLGPNGKSTNGGPQMLSEEQVRAQRATAASYVPDLVESTKQAQKAAGSCEPTTQASTTSRPPTPLNSDEDDDMIEDQKRFLATAIRRSAKGRTGA
jgi:hypothetical protein